MLLLFCVIVATAIALTVKSSKYDGFLTKLAKLSGMLFSFVPIVGLIMYAGLRGRPSGYGERCGAMALIGVAWFVVRSMGAKVFAQ
jgi:hypothetical protein